MLYFVNLPKGVSVVHQFPVISCVVSLCGISATMAHTRISFILFSIALTSCLAQKPVCTADHTEEFGAGEWVPASVPQNYSNMTWRELEKWRGYNCDAYFHFCTRRSDSELARAKRIAAWDWKPSSCTLAPFHPASFVNRFLNNSNASLYMVGDSITEQHFVSLTCQLSDFIVDHDTSEHPTRTTVTLASGARIEYVRDDFLVHNRTHQMLLRHTRDVHPHFHIAWAQALSSSPDAVLVLNTGAHWGDALSVEAVANVLDHLARHFTGTLFFRGTYEGVNACEDHTSPSHDGASSTKYNWNQFHLYNDLWRSAVRLYRSRGHRFYYLDGVTPLRQRPDARSGPPKDCLHVCMPGPIDVFTQSMAAALKSLQN